MKASKQHHLIKADGKPEKWGIPLKSKGDPMLPCNYRIHKVIQESSDTFTMALIPSGAHASISFKAGQFNMLYVFGVGEIPISISGNPERSETLIHTTRAVGTVTRVMKGMKKGMMLGVRGPYGSWWPMEKARGNNIVLVAGGIGLAPLRPVLYEILNAREEFGRVVLLYGARTPEDILFKKELKNWRQRFDIDVYLTVDRATGSWRGNVGVVTQLIRRAPLDPQQTTAMICGPEVMMRYTRMGLEERGIPADKIYLSMERNMKCALGFCGHCQYGETFVCKDGPVFRFDQIQHLFSEWEI